ncbi:MAG: monovalent cation/H(+) antiporter subunit G [Candidatus Thiosymbion ectosymbiont of Robbea hypermnestra]|nr:monovalent cation/H(+) antiporter subunit G [Candidatus Thiosymbion ectosymbiont of Robbea hypermnestra]
MTEALGVMAVVAGVAFFLAGSIGLLRLPDLLSRLHALTKADNLGLGLLALGVGLLDGRLLTGVKLFLIWLLVLAGSAVSTHLIARQALRQERG